MRVGQSAIGTAAVLEMASLINWPWWRMIIFVVIAVAIDFAWESVRRAFLEEKGEHDHDGYVGELEDRLRECRCVKEGA